MRGKGNERIVVPRGHEANVFFRDSRHFPSGFLLVCR